MPEQQVPTRVFFYTHVLVIINNHRNRVQSKILSRRT